MKKLWTVVIMLLFFVMLPLQSLGAQAAAAPKISVKSYKTEQIQYAVIHGDKYKAVNAKMYQEAKEAYATQKDLDKQLKEDRENGSIPDGIDYVIGLTPIVKYKTSTKIRFCLKTISTP